MKLILQQDNKAMHTAGEDQEVFFKLRSCSCSHNNGHPRAQTPTSLNVFGINLGGKKHKKCLRLNFEGADKKRGKYPCRFLQKNFKKLLF